MADRLGSGLQNLLGGFDSLSELQILKDNHMKIGVTGTRSGMTLEQFADVSVFLTLIQGVELHHGDCVGVDAEVAEMAQAQGYKIVCHPPEKSDLRAWFPSDEYREPTSYFKRNRQIVDECDMLIVVPYQTEPQSEGGTWYTYDYAVKKSKPWKIFYPVQE